MTRFKIAVLPALLVLFVLAFTFQSCKKKTRSEVGNVLFAKTQNKIFKDLNSDSLSAVFERVLASERSKLANPKIIAAFYKKNDYEPVFITDHFSNGDLKAMISYYQKANEHGLDPKIFQTEQINALLNKFYDKNGIKTLDEAYHNIAELEIATANSLINYDNAIQFGLISPRKIYQRYFTQTLRPDSISMSKVFHKKNLATFLDSIQPKDPQYVALQKALQSNYVAKGMTKEETQRAIIVNLERLRWKNKPAQPEYVLVNIPDYHLDVIQGGKSILGMKVCVGEGRNKDHENNLVTYDDSDKVDRPFSRETPQLNSMIYGAQVNPTWNIPKSIVSKELVDKVKDDPYYLSNMGIDVYKNGKLVEDPEEIDWADVTKNASDYEFKQAPGESNALGKIKFLFNNKSSVYLHDTPTKLPFNKPMRAVSHGCVRLEKPLDLAHVLFGDGDEYQKISKEIDKDNPEPETISLPRKVPVYITYVTCWEDTTGNLQFRPDVYGLDIVLYGHMQRLITAKESVKAVASTTSPNASNKL